MQKSMIITAFSLLILLTCFNVQASDIVWMNKAVVSKIEVESKADSATYYLYTTGNWLPATAYSNNAANCPTPSRAMIQSTQPGAEELLKLALESKNNQQAITIVGICGYHEAYFEIQRVIY